MKTCEVCGNEYDKTFDVNMSGTVHTFDCLECAVHALAPKCKRCGCRILGHGMEANGYMYCSAHCAHREGHLSLRDRAEAHGDLHSVLRL